MVKQLLGDELEMIWKEVVMAYFRYCPKISLFFCKFFVLINVVYCNAVFYRKVMDTFSIVFIIILYNYNVILYDNNNNSLALIRE
jgi:hypothetical protein